MPDTNSITRSGQGHVTPLLAPTVGSEPARGAGGPRDAAAFLAARLAVLAARLAGRNATSLPGMVAERVAPGLASRLAADVGWTCLVSGTNGKTTTARFLAQVLRAGGREVIANASGANLEQGVASALVASAGPRGRLRSEGAVAVLEVDEAALPAMVARLEPSVIVLTNLFRDQLDRFGETDHLVRVWSTMLADLPPEVTVVFCVDDPRLAALVARAKRTIGYGMRDPGVADAGITPDVTVCPACGESEITFPWSGVGHLGDYACDACGFRRPEPAIEVTSTGRGLDGQTLTFLEPATGTGHTTRVPFPGLGNAYNAAAAVAAAAALGIEPADAVATLADVSVPFGRFEELRVDGRRVVLSLIKNAASMAELARVVASAPVDTLLMVFSDNFQDGRDVSWYWDADPSPLIRGHPYVIAGRRAPDVALHLKYELRVDPGDLPPDCLAVLTSPEDGLDRAVAATPAGGLCFVVATYTSLLAIRDALVRHGDAPAMPR